jgi:hypothetical protein
MIYKPKSNFQNHPFHLVSPSPWPIYTSLSLFILTTSTVLFMHGFQGFEYLVLLSILNVIYSMGLWFRDVISEGKKKLDLIFSNIYLNMTRAIDEKVLEQIRNNKVNEFKINKVESGHYLAGLFEGDGHLSLPFLGQTILQRILNPRIVFTSHVNNIELYVYIQSMLNGKGRFQIVNDNTIRYIIGDIEGIKLFVNIVHGKLRSSKNESLNKLIDFINQKYNLIIPISNLDKSDFSNNSWLTGFTEADGHFGVKIVEAKPKSDTRKRSISNSISIKYRLDQRYLEGVNYILMESLSKFLFCKFSIYKTNKGEMLSLSVSAIEKIRFIIEYFNKYPLIGIKGKDFKDWEIVYNMMLSKQHLTDEGRLKIKSIQSNMNSKRKIKLNYKI